MRLDLRLLWLIPRPRDESAREPKAAIDRALEIFAQELLRVFPGDEITVSLVSTDHFVRGAADMKVAVDSCHLAIVEVTGADPDIAFALGLLAARDVPVILTQQRTDPPSLPMLSLVNSWVLPIQSIERPSSDMLRVVIDVTRRLRHAPVVPPADLRRVWFSDGPGDVYVIAAVEDHPTPYISLTDRNYIYIDGLIDRDTLFGVYGFLRRLYPSSTVIFASAEAEATTRPPYIENDLVVVGGPGVPDDGIPGNSVCRLMTTAAHCSVSYSADGEKASFGDRTWTADHTEKGVARRDFGYLARFANPFNPRSAVVMLQGLHTLGVLGAFQAISDSPRAYFNINRILDEVGPSASFEAGFYVEIHAGAVVCPTELELVELSG